LSSPEQTTKKRISCNYIASLTDYNRQSGKNNSFSPFFRFTRLLDRHDIAMIGIHINTFSGDNNGITQRDTKRGGQLTVRLMPEQWLWDKEKPLTPKNRGQAAQ
jgi:hypothetical protein